MSVGFDSFIGWVLTGALGSEVATYATEFVYVLRNRAFRDFVKIGFSRRLPEDRLPELNTAIPYPFEVAFRAATLRARDVETAVHRHLDADRVAPNREFFRTSVADAIEAIQYCQAEVTGISTWAPPPAVHHLRSGDWVILPVKPTDMFVLTAYQNFMDAQPGIIDFWQAHSTGDLLEIIVTGDPGHVAGISDDDPGGYEDPVPYLDRRGEVPNGMLIGRERLVSGDRLLWLSDIADGPAACASAVFEVNGFAQVTCRTRDPRPNLMNPLGLPFLLNDVDRDLTPAMISTTRRVLALDGPRTWAPRNPDPESDWAGPATHPQPPEFWLPQLRRHAKRR